MRTRADSPTKTCTETGCGRPLRARGLCGTHYNQQHHPDRHRKIAMTCAGCGDTIYKDSGSTKYANVYCSEMCRQWHRFGAWSTKLPADHWVFMFGATCRWRPPSRYQYTVDCLWCGTSRTSPRSDTEYCNSDCRHRAKRMRRRGREHAAPGEYRWTEIVKLWLTFDKACAYYHRPTPLTDIQAEHVEALSKGGRNDLGNLLPSCADCNADKRDLSLPEWAEDRKRRALPPVRTTWSETDPKYKHLVTRLARAA